MENKIKVENNHGGIHYYERVARNPSYLADIVNGISKLPFEFYPDTSNILSFDIANKLDHNNVIKYKQIIEDYAFYSNSINETYAAISIVKPNCRDKVMRIVNREYLRISSTILLNTNTENIMSIIKSNSDIIIESVLKILKEKLYEANNLETEIHNEDIDIAIEMIVGDAFINCKILENPNKN